MSVNVIIWFAMDMFSNDTVLIGGGIIAVGYEARARGVSRRNMRGDDAKNVCPEIKLFSVPEVRGGYHK